MLFPIPDRAVRIRTYIYIYIHLAFKMRAIQWASPFDVFWVLQVKSLHEPTVETKKNLGIDSGNVTTATVQFFGGN